MIVAGAGMTFLLRRFSCRAGYWFWVRSRWSRLSRVTSPSVAPIWGG